MAAEKTRKRRTWTRTQRGCKTCRLRHVKCDETYPFCKRCTTAGRTCDGCARPASGADWEVMTSSSISSSATSSPSPERQLNKRPCKDDLTEVSWAFFQQHTVTYLAGLLDSAWKPLLMRAIEQNDALYHAALAIGSVHKTVLSRGKLEMRLDEDQYAIKQYTRALQNLTPEGQGSIPASVDTVLLACILFIGFEGLRGNHGVVMQHVKSGATIVHQHRKMAKSQGANGIVSVARLLPAFARLERQFMELAGGMMILNQDLAAEQAASGYFDYGGPEPQPVPQFMNLHDALVGLHQRWHSLIAWTGMIHIDWFNHMGDVHKETNLFASPWDSNEVLAKRRAELSRDFDLWSFGLRELRVRLTNMTPKEEAVYALLECHILLAENVLETASLPLAFQWDNYRDQFAEIVAICHTIVEKEETAMAPTNGALPPLIIRHRYAPDELRADNAGPQPSSNTLTFEMGFCMILLHVVSKCRDAQIRLKAIRLLEDHPRLEGLWDGTLIAKTGRAIDSVERPDESLEEAAARASPASDIPPARRVLDLRAEMHLNSRSGDLMLFTGGRAWESKAEVTRLTLYW